MSLFLPHFLALEEVLEIHESQIMLFGGTAEVRDLGLLASALAQPEASFDNKFLHATLEEMAAAYLYHIVKNHPFVDGNKRTGTATALVFLDLNGVELDSKELDELIDGKTLLENLVIKVAEGGADKADLTKFFQRHRE
jgi:death-on-curing protein